MSLTSAVAANALAVWVAVTLLWLVSLAKRDASVVDPWWSMLFLLVSARTTLAAGLAPGKALTLALTAAWALRLWAFLLARARGQPEDPRYQAFRRHYGPARYPWVSYLQVFLLQGSLALVVSSPLVAAALAPAPDALRANDLLGALVFAVGLAFEAVADAQLARFRRDPANAGRALDTGLWRYTRHPNYFGEALVQWGLWITALDAPHGLPTALGPALMTGLLLRVSGVAMLERRLVETRPAYADYVRRTSAFLPWPPKP
jgi:steroid 5-alpha reductase family enzyme